MMAALPANEPWQPQPDTTQQAARAVLPVLLMDFEALIATYQAHWTSATTEAARKEGLPPATLADLKRLLAYRGDRQDQVHAFPVDSPAIGLAVETNTWLHA